MTNVTAIIITFLRPAYTKACVQSLKEQYPEINIIVGENGDHNPELAKFLKKRKAEYIQLPYDSGVCIARNRLIEKVKTEYVLVGDDDFFYSVEAKVDKMKTFLEGHKEFDVIGGRVSVDGEVKNYQGYIEKRPRCFVSTQIDLSQDFNLDEVSGLRYCKADLTFNYFVGRTAKIRKVPWDEEIKVAYEHFSWFYDFKVAGGKVAFTPDAIVVHKPKWIRDEVITDKRHPEYVAFRNRKSDKDRFFGKYQLDYTIGMNGKKTYCPNYTNASKTNDIKFVDFCITTFKRPKALEKLLLSICAYYPMANIYVADQNERFDRDFYKKLREKVFKAGLAKRPSIEWVGYDVGLSAARNHLVMTTPNKYKLILDDDFEFGNQTEIGKMVRLLDAFPSVYIVGGLVRQLGSEVHFEFTLENRDGIIYQVADGTPWREFEGIRYRKTGCVLNFALMRKELFNDIGWDTDLKVSEHMDFYLRMKRLPYQILYTPDVAVEHPPAERDADYKEFRQRKEFMAEMMRKHGATKIKYLNGQVTELMPDGSLAKYKEKPE